MKKLSDYQGEEAIELWADILEPAAEILADPMVANTAKKGKAPIVIAGKVLKAHKESVEKILLRIDPEPLNGLTVITRFVTLINEMLENDDLKVFFAMQGQKTADESFGSATANTEEKEI